MKKTLKYVLMGVAFYLAGMWAAANINYYFFDKPNHKAFYDQLDKERAASIQRK